MSTPRPAGPQIYAEVVGYGANCDAYHITAPAPGGAGGAACMTQALADAGRCPRARWATSTPTAPATHMNDACETAAIKTVFGPHANRAGRLLSTKSMTGHLLGGAGGVEAVFTALALRDQYLPATINYQAPQTRSATWTMCPIRAARPPSGMR